MEIVALQSRHLAYEVDGCVTLLLARPDEVLSSSNFRINNCLANDATSLRGSDNETVHMHIKTTNSNCMVDRILQIEKQVKQRRIAPTVFV